MCLAPFIGWLRDRIGLRWPTTIGWVLTAPLLWFSGVPGDSDFLGIGADRRGQGVFVATIIAIGICSSLVRGAGTFQLTCELLLIDIDLSFLLFCFCFFFVSRIQEETKQSLLTNRHSCFLHDIATLHQLRAQDPDIFGPGGGASRMFSLTEISFNAGLMLGPLVCGSISDAFGFYYTACVLGMTCLTTYATDLLALSFCKS